MTDGTTFDYDVAFSFTQQDEALATELNDLIADRLRTFIYSERQKEIAGTDGQESFSKVYGGSARIVVVLYRAEWGNTRWTTVESTAIRTRAYEQGFDFTVFIPTDKSPLPKWLPPTRLYVGLERWGWKGAAAVIEQRVLDAGGAARHETAVERAARAARAEAFSKEKYAFRNSEAGVNQATEAYQRLWAALQNLSSEMAGQGLKSTLREARGYRIVALGTINLIMWWEGHWANTLDESKLTVEFYRGFPKLAGFYGSRVEAVRLDSDTFTFELIRSGEAGFVRGSTSQSQYTPESMADALMRELMDHSENNPAR